MSSDSRSSQAPSNRVVGTSPPNASASAVMSGQHGLQTSIDNITGTSNATTITSCNNNNSGNILPTKQNVTVLSAAAKTTPTTIPTTDKSSRIPADDRRPIRTLRPIDLSKLQECGLDRKIAEILSKQKQINHAKRLTNETKHGSNKGPSFNTPSNLYKVLKPIPTLASATPSACVTAPQGSITASTTPSHLSSFRTVTRPVAKAESSSSSSSTSSSASSSPIIGPKSIPNKPIIPPKITVTAPEPCSKNEKSLLNDLTPDERLNHVKHLLHRKLLQKKQVSTTNRDGKILFAHLKPPALCLQELPKASIKTQVMSKPQIKVEKDKLLTPPAEDILARNLSVTYTNKLPNKPRILNTPGIAPGMLYSKASGKIFVIKKEPQPNATGVSFYPSSTDKKLTYNPSAKVGNPLNADTNLQDTSSMDAKNPYQEHWQTTPSANDPLNVDKDLPHTPPVDTKHLHQEHWETTPVSRLPTKPKTPQKSPQDIARKIDFQEEEHPRTAQYSRNTIIKPTMSPTLNATTRLVHDVLHYKVGIPKDSVKSPVMISKQRIFTPDVSPLKAPFPTANVPQETPLPTIDTFKKPYPMPDSNYYTMMSQAQPHLVYTNIQSSNYQIPQHAMVTAATSQLPPPSMGHNDYNFTASSDNNMAPNSLIVLENKVLSQDEMIDLTALRLSKFDTPLRFARPHKPIVEIKQEKPDEHMSHTASTSGDVRRNTPTIMEENTSTNLQSGHRHLVMFSSKQNKKFIINAQQLKLPPEKIADLAKHIAERTAVERKYQDKRDLLNTNTLIRSKPFKPIDQTSTYTKPIDNVDIAPTRTLKGGVIESNASRNTSTLPLVGFKNMNLLNNLSSPQNFQSGHPNVVLKNEVNVSPRKIGANFDNRKFLLVVKDQEPYATKNTITNPKYPTDSREKFHPSVKPLPHDSLIKTEHCFNSSQSLNKCTIPKNRQPAVEIKAEPIIEDSFSAVDFLASFAYSNPIIELTPDELNLNASCSMNFSPLRVPNFSPHKRKISSSISQQQRQITIPTSPLKKNVNSLQIGNIYSLSGENNATINNEPINVSMPLSKQTLPTPLSTLLVHDLLFNKVPGVGCIPKASIKTIGEDDNNDMLNKELINVSGSLIKPVRITDLPNIPKASIKSVHTSPSSSNIIGSPPIVDTIVIASSNGRDHVLRKSLDSESPVKLDKISISRDNGSFKAGERLKLHSELNTPVETLRQGNKINVAAEAVKSNPEVYTSTEGVSKLLSNELLKQSEIDDEDSENLLVPLYVIRDGVKEEFSKDQHWKNVSKATLLKTKYVAEKRVPDSGQKTRTSSETMPEENVDKYVQDSNQKKRTTSESILKNAGGKYLSTSSQKKRTSSEPSTKETARKDLTSLKKMTSEMLPNDITQIETVNSSPLIKKSSETVNEKETSFTKSTDNIMGEVQSELSNYNILNDAENCVKPTSKAHEINTLNTLECKEINLCISNENAVRLTLDNYSPGITDKNENRNKPLTQSKSTECNEQNAAPNISVMEVSESCNSLKSILKSTPVAEENDKASKKSKIPKITEDLEQSKPNELNSVPPTTSKRISRFKKGKINLVQRNKPSTTSSRQSENSTSKANDKIPEVIKPTVIDEPNKMSDEVILPAGLPTTLSSSHTDNKTNSSELLPVLEGEPNKNDKLAAEKKLMDQSICMANDCLSVKQICNESKRSDDTPVPNRVFNSNNCVKELEVGDAAIEVEKQLQILPKTVQEAHQPASENQNLTKDISISDIKLSNSGVTNFDEVKCVTEQVSQVIEDNENNNRKPEVSGKSQVAAESLNIAAVSRDTALSNSALAVKSMSANLEISENVYNKNRASSDIPQNESNIGKNIKLADELIIKETINSAIGDTSLSQQRKEIVKSPIYVDSSDVKEKLYDITSGTNEAEQLKEIIESSKDHVTTKICNSFKPPKNPKRNANKKVSDDVPQVSKLNVNKMRRLSVSLVDIVKNPSPELHVTPPQIPFKRKRIDITLPNENAEPKGIRNLINQIKGNKEDNVDKYSRIETENTNENQKKNATTKETIVDIADNKSRELPTAKEIPERNDNPETDITPKGKGANETVKTPTSVKTPQEPESELSKSESGPKSEKETEAPNTKDCASIKGRRSTRLSLVVGNNEEVIETPKKLCKQGKSINSTDSIEGNDLKMSEESNITLNESNVDEDIKKPSNQHKYNLAIKKRVRYLTGSPDTKDLAQSSSEHFSTAYAKSSIKMNITRSKTPSKCYEQVPIEKEIISNTSDISERLHCSRLRLNSSDIEDSCLDRSAQVPEALLSRKRLRKTLEDVKKSQQASYTDTDSDNDHDFDSMNGGCEVADDFLGFEDNSLGSPKNKTNIDDGSSSEGETKLKNATLTKGGTMKNWLTTGKAISPTFMKDHGLQRIRHGGGKKISVTRGKILLKKRCKLSTRNLQEETDITDDTSPADDEEDDVALFKKSRCNLKSVIDSSKLTKNNCEDNTATLYEFVTPMSVEIRTNVPEAVMDTPISCGGRLKRARRLISDDLEETSVTTENLGKAVLEIDTEDKESTENKCISDICDSNVMQLTIPASNKNSDSKTLIAKKVKSKVTNRVETSLKEETMGGLIAENLVENIIRKSEPIVNISPISGLPNRMENVDNKDDTRKKSKNDKSVCKEQTPKTTLKIVPTVNLKRKLTIDESELHAEVKDNAADKTLGSRNLAELDSAKSAKTSKRRPQIEKSTRDSKVVIKNIPQSCDQPKPPTVKPGDKVLAAPNTTRGRPKKTQHNQEPIIPQKCDESKTPTPGSSAQVFSTPTSSVKRKGRPSSIPDSENIFNPRLLLITKREQLNTDEPLTEAKAGTGNIQCGLCMQRTVQSKWRLHLAEHYGIGWKQGGEKVNVNNRSSVLGSIIAFLKDSEIATLNCRMCKKSYRSGLGILSHIESCGAEQQRRNCPYCQKDYTILSLPVHIRTCPIKIKPLTEVSDKNLEIPTEKVLSTTGRTKRVSTIKAEGRLKQIGEELVKAVEDIKFNPKLHIHYNAPLGDVIRKKWLKDIAKNSKGVCPAQSCRFSSDTVDTLVQHLKECKLIQKPGFYCKLCKHLGFETEQDAIKHVIEYHPPGKDFSDDSDCNIKIGDEQSSNDDDDEGSEGIDDDEASQLDISKCNSSKPKKGKKNPKQSSNQTTTQIILRKKIFDKRAFDISPTVKKKWKNFTKMNFISTTLYANLKCHYYVLKTQQYMKYLPLQDVSMKCSFKNKASLPSEIGVPENDIEWTQIERFNSINFQNEVFLFVGAPITYCSWLPLPAHVEDQYLLVAYRKDSFKFVKFVNPKHVKTTLLLFKVTQPEKGSKVPQIRLHYGFTIDDGPVYNFAFIPSGGYSSNDNRLGLVAVASVLPSIKVYSLPINVLKNCGTDNSIPLIQLAPSFELCLEVPSEEKDATKHTLMNPQCLQVAWSEFSGHNHIFAGFSNGFIGIWDITDDLQNNLNRFEVLGKCLSYTPLNYFYVGEKGIRCFAIHYDTTGPRWIAVACFYRRLVVYDIGNMMEPIALKEDYNRNIMRCIEWCPIWEPFLAGYCDSIPNNGRCIQCINPSNIMYTQQKMENFVSAVSSIHYTPHLNMCVASVDNGDILFMDTRELHYEYVLDRKFGDRRILSFMDIKKLDGKPITRLIGQPIKNRKTFSIEFPPIEQKLEDEWLLYDPDFKEKYGLVFQPVIKMTESLKTQFLSENRRAPLNMAPYMRINTLRCNLNTNAKRLIAVGHENGFLRVIYFDKDSQFRKS